MANVNIPVYGYPTAAWGQTKVWRGDHFGPTAYNNTTGEIVTPTPFTLNGIETVGAEFGGFTYSNNYYVKMFLPNNITPSSSEYASPVFGVTLGNNANANNMPQIQWFYAANNNQVAANTNLAAEAIRLVVYGV